MIVRDSDSLNRLAQHRKVCANSRTSKDEVERLVKDGVCPIGCRCCSMLAPNFRVLLVLRIYIWNAIFEFRCTVTGWSATGLLVHALRLVHAGHKQCAYRYQFPLC
jgi:hypothetical protein